MKAEGDRHEAEQSAQPLSWTGERCIPGEADFETFYEHIHRYLFASTLVAGRDVLDIGSGEGYGAAILARTAKRVTALELDPLSVAHSANKYVLDKLTFTRGSATDLANVGDATIDVAVCFEVIEHVAGHDALMANAKRVLRKHGLLILSTPDRDNYGSDGHDNPFHVRELNRSELVELISSFFHHYALYAQTFTVGSIMSRLSDLDRSSSTLDFIIGGRSIDAWTADPIDKRPYLIAVASESELPQIPTASHLHDSTLEFAHAAHGWRDQASAWQREAADRERTLEASRREIDRYDSIASTRTWRAASAARSLAFRCGSAVRSAERFVGELRSRVAGRRQ